MNGSTVCVYRCVCASRKEGRRTPGAGKLSTKTGSVLLLSHSRNGFLKKDTRMQ